MKVLQQNVLEVRCQRARSGVVQRVELDLRSMVRRSRSSSTEYLNQAAAIISPT